MALDPQFAEWMTSTIGVQNITGLSTDGYGARSYGSVIPVKAKVENGAKLVKTHDGREIVSPITVYAPPYDNTNTHAALTIGPTSRVMLPANTSPLIISSSAYLPPVLRVDLHADEFGDAMYWEISLGEVSGGGGGMAGR